MSAALKCGALCSRLSAPVCATYLSVANIHHHKERHDIERFIGLRRSFNRKPNRHWDPKWRVQRRKKYINVPVPDYEAMRSGEMPPEQLRAFMLKQGIRPVDLQPDRPWSKEREVHIESIGSIAEPFVPPADETRASILSKENLNEWKEWGKKRLGDRAHRRRLRKHPLMEGWNETDFAVEAEGIYVDAMNALCEGDEYKMHELMAPLAFQKTLDFVGLGTLRWSLVKRVTEPTVVRIRIGDFPPKSGNDFAQVTVRMHNEQSLALYDQFGRLKMGSETKSVPVLEYIVFERGLALAHGRWRVLDMIVPEQHHQRTPIAGTLRLQNVEDKVKQRVEQRQRALNRLDYLSGSKVDAGSTPIN